ncbi:hypothetical protein 10KY502B_gene0060 [Xanthomonas phage 10KY502B]|nr:hypothetical protein 10KY502B_gene0060 [Xanthomonas phage 10KY502B]
MQHFVQNHRRQCLTDPDFVRGVVVDAGRASVRRRRHHRHVQVGRDFRQAQRKRGLVRVDPFLGGDALQHLGQVAIGHRLFHQRARPLALGDSSPDRAILRFAAGAFQVSVDPIEFIKPRRRHECLFRCVRPGYRRPLPAGVICSSTRPIPCPVQIGSLGIARHQLVQIGCQLFRQGNGRIFLRRASRNAHDVAHGVVHAAGFGRLVLFQSAVRIPQRLPRGRVVRLLQVDAALVKLILQRLGTFAERGALGIHGRGAVHRIAAKILGQQIQQRVDVRCVGVVAAFLLVRRCLGDEAFLVRPHQGIVQAHAGQVVDQARPRLRGVHVGQFAAGVAQAAGRVQRRHQAVAVNLAVGRHLAAAQRVQERVHVDIHAARAGARVGGRAGDADLELLVQRPGVGAHALGQVAVDGLHHAGVLPGQLFVLARQQLPHHVVVDLAGRPVLARVLLLRFGQPLVDGLLDFFRRHRRQIVATAGLQPHLVGHGRVQFRGDQGGVLGQRDGDFATGSDGLTQGIGIHQSAKVRAALAVGRLEQALGAIGRQVDGVLALAGHVPDEGFEARGRTLARLRL